jgi:hypothetical protein
MHITAMASPHQEFRNNSNGNARVNSEHSPITSITDNGAASGSRDLSAPLMSTQEDKSNSQPITASSRFKKIWSKLGINGTVAALMFKGALAPLIATAIYQNKSVAFIYVNFGYLLIVVSILAVTILPRGKFMMNLSISVVSAETLVEFMDGRL